MIMPTIRKDVVPLLLSTKMASGWVVQGCSMEEVESLEKQYGIRLPLAYREFLLIMGYGAGALFRGTDAFYRRLSELREGAEELLAEDNADFKMPADCFVFAMHQGYQFWFFYLSEAVEDPPVYYYYEGWERPRW